MDRPSPSRTAPSPAETDPLSDVLRSVRLSAAVFVSIQVAVDAAAPWGNAVPDGSALASALGPRFQRIISYHVVTRGRAWCSVPGEPAVEVGAGEVVVFPHGDAYCISLDPELHTTLGPDAMRANILALASGRAPMDVRDGAGGPKALGLVCGFLGCDMEPFNPLVATLPRILVVRRDASSTTDGLDRLIDLALAEARAGAPGGECVRLRLSELMFVEVIRRHVAALPPEQQGWLAGLRDPIVGRALALLHGDPGRAWTLQSLAKKAGVSRSVLADRFTRLVGRPPMQYLAHWRMQVAARLLAEGSSKISAVALEVGYDSEAAFSRAFKKAGGMSPAAWRQRYAAANAARH